MKRENGEKFNDWFIKDLELLKFYWLLDLGGLG
jgi:hypothetical protein